MIIAVSGWRKWSNKSTVVAILGGLIERYTLSQRHYSLSHLTQPRIRYGDCKTGVDSIVEEITMEWRLAYEKYNADWEAFGKAAGPLRNRDMLNGVNYSNASPPPEKYGQRANLLLAFPEPRRYPHIHGSGTWGCIGEATNMGIPVLTVATEKPMYTTGYFLEVLNV